MKDKRRNELQSFVSSLYESGKLTDAVMTQEKLVGFCEGLDDGTLEFSEEAETPSAVMLNLLASLPALLALPGSPGGLLPHLQELQPGVLHGLEHPLQPCHLLLCQWTTPNMKKSEAQSNLI